MKPRTLLLYQLLTGLPDAATGLLLIFAPAFTLRLMLLHADLAALPFLSFIGAFVLSVGIACLYGAWLAMQARSAEKLKVVWLLTAISRGSVALFVTSRILDGTLEEGWASVAVADAVFSLFQAIGLYKGWLNDFPTVGQSFGSAAGPKPGVSRRRKQ